MYDLLIKNATIADGCTNATFESDIAINDGKITRIGKELSGAKEIIDATGNIVSPGFIDSHSHSDTSLFSYPDQKEKIEQGITTSVSGCCGESPAPNSLANPEKNKYLTMGEFLREGSKISLGSNMAVYVGHGTIRQAVMGMENRAPTRDELEKMKFLLADAMENGALGLSFGLIYTPGCYGKTDELIELSKVVKQYDGIISAHIRDEGDFLVEAVLEFIKIIKESENRGVLSHHKSAWQKNWGKTKKTLALIDQANSEGCDIYCDVYPYIASRTSVSARFIPKEYHAYGIKDVLADEKKRQEIKETNIKIYGEDLSFALVTNCDGYPQYEGLNLTEISEIHKKEPYETVFDMLMNSEVCNACFFSMCEEDVERVMSYDRTMICTDSDVACANKVYHPRLRASFPRVLGRYVRERNVTTLTDMIRKMTSLPADVYGFKNKGRISEGYDADICIFNPDTIIDRSDFLCCQNGCEGLSYVIVGGKVAAKNGIYTGERNAKLLLRNM